jgi:O-antigen ligase
MSSRITPFARADTNLQASASAIRTRQGTWHLYNTSVVVLVLCLVYLDIPDYVHALNGALLPKYFFFAFAALCAPLLLRFTSLSSYLLSPFALWAYALILLNIAHFSFAVIDGDETTAGLISTRIQYAVLAILLGFACWIGRSGSYERVFPILALVIPTTVIVDFLVPGLFYPPGTEGTVLGRAGATLLNPNKAGESMLLTLLLAMPLMRSHHRALLLLWVGIAVMLTFSRAAILGWMLLWLVLVIRREVPKYTIVIALLLVGVLPLLHGSFEHYLRGRQEFYGGVENLLARLEFFATPVLDDDSALDRRQVTQAALDLFWQNPVFGAGAGATASWSQISSAHNQVIMLAAEYGLFGIAIWLSLAVILWNGRYFESKAWQVIAPLGFIFLSMFSHNLFDFAYWLLTFALISALPRPLKSLPTERGHAV